MLEGLLRANLHQRQYADLVARVLSRLASSGGVSNDELSLLWNIAQKASWPACAATLFQRHTRPAQQPMCALCFVPDVSALACTGVAVNRSLHSQRSDDNEMITRSQMQCGGAVQADTFEAVRANVYSLLGTLAMALGPVQLDVLFSFFESGGASGAAGDSYLMELLQKLIDSDTQACHVAQSSRPVACRRLAGAHSLTATCARCLAGLHGVASEAWPVHSCGHRSQLEACLAASHCQLSGLRAAAALLRLGPRCKLCGNACCQSQCIEGSVWRHSSCNRWSVQSSSSAVDVSHSIYCHWRVLLEIDRQLRCLFTEWQPRMTVHRWLI